MRRKKCVWSITEIYIVTGFNVTHIHTKIHQYLISVFLVFAQTNKQTDQNNTCIAQHS